jgi:hypothetical protein
VNTQSGVVVRNAAPGLQPSGVLACDQAVDRRCAVTDDVRRLAADDVEQLAVEEEQPVDVAGHQGFDQHPVALTRRQKHRSAQLQVGADAGSDADPSPCPVRRLDHNALRVLVQELQRRPQPAHITDDMRGQRDAGVRTELVRERRVERRAQRHTGVESDLLLVHPRRLRVEADLQHLARAPFDSRTEPVGGFAPELLVEGRPVGPQQRLVPVPPPAVANTGGHDDVDARAQLAPCSAGPHGG